MLADNTAKSCPVEKKQLASYVSLEAGERVAQRCIRFVRTAKLDRTKYWLWRYETKEGQAGWIAVHTMRWLGLIPTSCTGSWGHAHWSAEEFLRRYHWTQVLRRPHGDFPGFELPGA